MMHQSTFLITFAYLMIISSLIKTKLQIQSFEAELQVPAIAATEGGAPTFRGVFIRAPAILEVGPEVEVLADFTVQSNKAADPNYALESQEEVCYKFYFSVNCMTCNILTRAS